MRTQWTTKGNRDAGSSCSCDRGLHRDLRKFEGGGFEPPQTTPSVRHWPLTFIWRDSEKRELRVTKFHSQLEWDTIHSQVWIETAWTSQHEEWCHKIPFMVYRITLVLDGVFDWIPSIIGVWWVINCKGFWRMRSWPIRCNKLVFGWTGWGEPKTNDRHASRNPGADLRWAPSQHMSMDVTATSAFLVITYDSRI